MKKGILLLCNIILILGSVLSVFIYSENFRKENRKMQMETFSSTIESMKKVSENYLYTERGYVDNWAEYIPIRICPKMKPWNISAVPIRRKIWSYCRYG